MMRNKLFLTVLLLVVIFIVSCTPKPAEEISVVEEEIPSETSSAPAEQPKEEVPAIPAQLSPALIDGKAVEERLAEAYERLHTRGSAEHIRKSFPDIELVYTDDAVGMPFPREIIPFRYYYSSEADTTFNICAVDFTVFICKGKLDKLIRKVDIDSGRCEMTPIYGDPRL